MKMKNLFRKACDIYPTHMEEEFKDKVPKIQDHLVLKEYEDVFGDIPWFPPKRDIKFSINLILGAALISKTT